MKTSAVILLSTYQGEKYLAAQIDSIIAQQFTNWTLLIRDDGSSDATLDIIQYYCRIDARIHQVIDDFGNLRAPQSFGALLKTVFEQGERLKNEYIFFSDQDDVWLPNKLTQQIALLREMENQYGSETPILIHTDLCVVNSELQLIHPSYLKFEKLKRNVDNPLSTLLINNFITGCTVGFNHALLRLVYPIPKDVFMHDWWCGLVAAASGGKIGFVEAATLLYRQHDQNAVGSVGFYGKFRELKSGDKFKASFVRRRKHLRQCFLQSECLMSRLERIGSINLINPINIERDLVKVNANADTNANANANVQLIKKFVTLLDKNLFMRYLSLLNLKLKPMGHIRKIAFWFFLAWV